MTLPSSMRGTREVYSSAAKLPASAGNKWSALTRILGVPERDNPKFSAWSKTLTGIASRRNPLTAVPSDLRSALLVSVLLGLAQLVQDRHAGRPPLPGGRRTTGNSSPGVFAIARSRSLTGDHWQRFSSLAVFVHAWLHRLGLAG